MNKGIYIFGGITKDGTNGTLSVLSIKGEKHYYKKARYLNQNNS